MAHQVYSVSWNLTQRCNLHCAHCYMSAFAGADTSRELSTDECRKVMANGLPVGLQIMGRSLDEATLLRVAHAYEQATNWRDHRPPLVLRQPGDS